MLAIVSKDVSVVGDRLFSEYTGQFLIADAAIDKLTKPTT
jgi:hypothetical protein